MLNEPWKWPEEIILGWKSSVLSPVFLNACLCLKSIAKHLFVICVPIYQYQWRKNWGAKELNSSVDLNSKWMGHFGWQKPEAGGTGGLPKPVQKRGCPSRRSSLTMNSVPVTENIRQFNSLLIDWVGALAVLRVCTTGFVLVRVCVRESGTKSIINRNSPLKLTPGSLEY